MWGGDLAWLYINPSLISSIHILSDLFMKIAVKNWLLKVFYLPTTFDTICSNRIFNFCFTTRAFFYKLFSTDRAVCMIFINVWEISAAWTKPIVILSLCYGDNFFICSIFKCICQKILKKRGNNSCSFLNWRIMKCIFRNVF